MFFCINVFFWCKGNIVWTLTWGDDSDRLDFWKLSCWSTSARYFLDLDVERLSPWRCRCRLLYVDERRNLRLQRLLTDDLRSYWRDLWARSLLFKMGKNCLVSIKNSFWILVKVSELMFYENDNFFLNGRIITSIIIC